MPNLRGLRGQGAESNDVLSQQVILHCTMFFRIKYFENEINFKELFEQQTHSSVYFCLFFTVDNRIFKARLQYNRLICKKFIFFILHTDKKGSIAWST